MATSQQQPTAEEIAAAYRKAKLRYAGVTLTRALTSPLIYKSLCLQVMAMRRAGQMPAMRTQCATN